MKDIENKPHFQLAWHWILVCFNISLKLWSGLLSYYSLLHTLLFYLLRQIVLRSSQAFSSDLLSSQKLLPTFKGSQLISVCSANGCGCHCCCCCCSRYNLGLLVAVPCSLAALLPSVCSLQPALPLLLSLLFMFCYPLTRALALVFYTHTHTHTLILIQAHMAAAHLFYDRMNILRCSCSPGGKRQHTHTRVCVCV